MDVETPCHRHTFYVGGAYAEDTISGLEGFILRGQTYVECLTPVGGARQETQVIFVHGGGQSGTNWLQTPDGRKGWASAFLDHGYQVYLIDTASRGRSCPDFSQKHIQYPTGLVQDLWTSPAVAAKWPQARLHTQWPGTGRHGDAVFEQYYASILPSLMDIKADQEAQKAGITALLDRIGRPTILVTHSQGGPGGWLAADGRPRLVKAIIAVEPSGPPFSGQYPHNGEAARVWGLTDVPMTFSPSITDPSQLNLRTVPSTEDGKAPMVLQDDARVVHKLTNLSDIPVLVEVGEASYHAGFDHATVEFLRQAGVECDFIKLEDIDIRGNGHMQMLELNNLEIAAVLLGWLDERLGKSETK